MTDTPKLPQIPALQTSILEKLLERAMAPRKGLYYVRQVIYLDGLVFEECSFENCTFITNSGTFTIRNCRIYGPESKFLYGDAALKIVKLFEHINSAWRGYSTVSELSPKVGKDGHLTIE